MSLRVFSPFLSPDRCSQFSFRFTPARREWKGGSSSSSGSGNGAAAKKKIQRGRIGWEGRKEAGKEEKEKKKKKENFLCLVFRLGSVSSCPAKSVTEQPTAEEEEKKKKK